MDERALRLEQVRMDLQTNERMVDLKGRRHVAVLAVALTTGAGASAAAVLGQVPTAPAAMVAGLTGVVVVSQVRAFGALERQLARGRQAARAAVERLIVSEVASEHDETAEAYPELAQAMGQLEAVVRETASLPLFWPRKARLDP